VVFFFFQAEDGIRDLIVTGVQTCALPILISSAPPRARSTLDTRVSAPIITFCSTLRLPKGFTSWKVRQRPSFAISCAGRPLMSRSEERRVGREGGCWERRVG